MIHLHSTTSRRKPCRTPTNAAHTIRCIVFICLGPLSVPKPDHTKKTGKRKGHSPAVSVHADHPTPPPASESSFGALSAPKSMGKIGSGHSPPVSAHIAIPKATANVSIRFRRAERAQTGRHRKNNQENGKGHSRPVSLHADHPTPPPASESSFGALSAPKE